MTLSLFLWRKGTTSYSKYHFQPINVKHLNKYDTRLAENDTWNTKSSLSLRGIYNDEVKLWSRNITFSSSAFLQYRSTSAGLRTWYCTLPSTLFSTETSIFSELKRKFIYKYIYIYYTNNNSNCILKYLLERLCIECFEKDAHGEVDGLFGVNILGVVLFEHARCRLAIVSDAGCFPSAIVSRRITLIQKSQFVKWYI